MPPFGTTFRALGYRNFRLFFVGQGISLVGTWIQQIAMGWLVYRLTNSAFMLGVVGFSSQIPSFILSPLTGVLADRWNRRTILVLTQIFSMAQAFILAYLTLSGKVAVWHIVSLGALLGLANSVDIPARQSFIIDMVERKELLGNAIALNSFMFNAARLIGPSIAGIIIGVSGEGVCFLVNGLSFFAVLISLLMMKIKDRRVKGGRPNVIAGLAEGISYTFGFAPIRSILILLGIYSLMGMSYAVLMPVFARDILRGGPDMMGFLMASVGVGALVGTIYLASRKRVVRLGRTIPVAAFIFSASIIVFSLSRVPWLSSIILVFTGFGLMVHMASSNTVIQTIVDDDKRGRVMSFYAMAFMGMAPIGSLLAGAMASWVGAPNTLIIGGIFCLAAAFQFAREIPILKAMARPAYFDTIPLISAEKENTI